MTQDINPSEYTSPFAISRHTAPAVLAAFVALAFVTLVTAAQVVPYINPRGPEPLTWSQALVISGSRWMIWIVPTPFIVEFGLRFDFRAGRRLASVMVHALLLAGSSVLVWVCISRSLQSVNGVMRAEGFTALMRRTLVGTQPQTAALTYLLIIGLAAGVRAWQQSRDATARAARSEVLAAEARLETLAARLQPHFLFNTLHMVGSLIHTQPEEARSVLSELGDLLREALSDSGSGEVTVQEEIRLAERYLAIVGRRFGDRLRLTLSVEPACLAEPVPRFLLQPLLENAIQHGVAPEAEGGELRLAITRERGTMRVAVWNPGRIHESVASHGLGIGATRERAAMWRTGTTFSLGNRGGGVEAVLLIPLRSTA